MKKKLQLISACIAALALCAPMAAFAAPTKSPPPKSSAAPSPPHRPNAKALPFHGKISAVDQKAKTFTIAGKEKSRVFKVTDQTVMTKGGAPATMKDVVVDEQVRGSYLKYADGSLEAKTVKLGPQTDAEKSPSPKKKKTKPEASPDASPASSPAASPSASPAASASPSASPNP